MTPNTILAYFNPFATTSSLRPSAKKEDVEVQQGKTGTALSAFRFLFNAPSKLLLWNRYIGSGNISAETIDAAKTFLHDGGLHNVAILADAYSPGTVWHRIFSNPRTSLLGKCTLGLGSGITHSLGLFKLIGADHYDPMANTVNLFSNDPSMALHECGHAQDFQHRLNPSLYFLTRSPIFSFVSPIVGGLPTLYQEYQASNNAIQYLRDHGQLDAVKSALKTLIPAFASYCAVMVSKGSLSIYLDTKNCMLGDMNACNSLIQAAIPVITIFTIGHAIGRVLAAQEQLTPHKSPILPV